MLCLGGRFEQPLALMELRRKVERDSEPEPVVTGEGEGISTEMGALGRGGRGFVGPEVHRGKPQE